MSKLNKGNPQVSADAVLNHYYERYSAELSGLWQHSVFSWTFETLLFTGYGFLVFEMIKCKPEANPQILNKVALALGFIGLCATVIWIALAKSAKTWQHYYEEFIVSFEQSPDLFPFKRRFAMAGEGVKIRDVDSSLRSVEVGSFSMGKLNVFMSHFVWLLWLLITILHAGFYIKDFSVFKIFVLLTLVVIYVLYILILKEDCKSSAIRKEDYGEEYRLKVFLYLEDLKKKVPGLLTREDYMGFFFDEYERIGWRLSVALSGKPEKFDEFIEYSDFFDLLKAFKADYMKHREESWLPREKYAPRIEKTLDGYLKSLADME